jgi:DNA-binding response OmpR family regulator
MACPRQQLPSAKRRRDPRHQREKVACAKLDPVAREVRFQGKAVELTAHEYALVVAFAEHPDRILSRRQLEDALYTFDNGTLSNVVEVYVSRLRRKFGRHAIRTIRGIGYRWGEAGRDMGEVPE